MPRLGTRSSFALAAAVMIGVPPAGAQPTKAATNAQVDVLATARSLFQQYGQALSAAQRSGISRFYSRQGAYFVLDGQTLMLSWSAIDSIYRLRWKAPTYFAWDSLTFEVVPPTSVMAFGRFRWQNAGASDTTVFSYAALLVRTDSGLAIRLEHETALSPRRP